MHSLYQQLTVFNIDPAVFQVDASGTQAFHLCALQLHTRFQRFQNKILVARFTVCGDGFGRRTLFGGCHATRLLSPFLLYQYTIFSRFCKSRF